MSSLKGRDLLSLADLTPTEVHELLDLAQALKAGKIQFDFQRKTLGLLFRKASTRTRVSFITAMHQLGGHVIDLHPNVTQVSRGEPVEDTARVLDRYVDILAIRTFAQSELETFAKYCRIPIINALSDLEHPCQVLADLLTVKEAFGKLEGLTLTYVGDGNNMAHSLMIGCALVGMNIRVASPANFAPSEAVVAQARGLALNSEVIVTTDPQAASEKNLADKDAIVLHCLPAHRGEEITADVIEGTQSRVWDEAENRLHAQKALLASLL